MSRKCFISYSHRLDQKAVDRFQSDFGDEWSAFIDRSIRDDVGDLADSTIKSKLSTLIKGSTVTIILVGAETGGRWWVDWEIKNSLRRSEGNERSGLLAINIPNKQHWVPQRFLDNRHMGIQKDWPQDGIQLQNWIEDAYNLRWQQPVAAKPLRKKNSSRK